MKRATVLGLATLWLTACGGDDGSSRAPVGAAGTPAAASTTAATAGGGRPATADGAVGAAAVSGKGGSTGSIGMPAASNTGTPTGAGTTANPAGSASGSAAIGGSGGAAAVSGGSGSAAVSGNSSGSAAVSGGGGSAGSADIPPPMSAPLVWGFGLGITDVPAATKFYAGAMMMAVERDAVKRDDRTETTLYATQAMRGARVVLMQFDDTRETHDITTKLVWQAPDPAAVDATAAMYPDYVSRLNIGIVQFDGPETYIQEVGSSFDTGGTGISVPYPVAMGFAVSDQPAALAFYTALGMTQSMLGTFSVTDATGAGSITEYSVKFDDGMGLVLQAWTPARNAKDNPVKIVMFVPDAMAMADKIAAAGGTIIQPAERTPVYDNRMLIVAKDLDGYVIEVVE